MSDNTGLTTNSKLFIQRNGYPSEIVTVIEVGEYVTVKYNNNSVKTFIPIFDTKTLIDIENGFEYMYTLTESTGENGEFSINVTFRQAVLDPSLQDVTERMVWDMIGSTAPTCNCYRCLVRQIVILESALRTVPDTPECILAAIFINEVMIPRISRLASENIFSKRV